MKKNLVVFISIVILVGVMSCSSETKKSTNFSAAQLILGKWEAVYWEKFDERREAEDLEYTLNFSKNASFQSFIKGKKVLEGTWHLRGSLLSIEKKDKTLEKAEILKLDQDRLVLFKASQNAKFIFERK